MTGYRDALQVSQERIARLNEEELNELMRALLLAQGHRCGADVSKVLVNTEGQAKDDGSDGSSPIPNVADPWLGGAATCWQFKVGAAGQPAKLKGEVTKRIPAEMLLAGGRFTVVATGSTNGAMGERDRLEVLVSEAAAAGLPTSSIEVIGSERLTNWCNQHPAIAARWAGRPEGLWSLKDWASLDVHQVAWQSTAAAELVLAQRRVELEAVSGEVLHLHIQGPPGVGKTRLALELCRGAAWRGEVVYLQQASDFRLVELIDSAVADPEVRLLVVADEVQADQILVLRNSVARGSRRIRIITIGHVRTPDPVRIPAMAVSPLERKEMAAVVSGWHSSMPREHVDFVVSFSDGFVRLARLASDAVMRAPTIDVRGLMDQEHIRTFLDGMLGPDNRRSLYVVAALTSVGWTDERQAEGEAIARHLHLDWNTVRAEVEAFHRKFAIVPRGGRLRYISPTPLGVHLAIEAWTTFPDLMKSLPDALPSEAARDAYYDRIQAIASTPQARRFARENLALFFRLGDFVDERAVRRWSSLVGADPAGAAAALASALDAVSVQDRQAISSRARREVVWCLVKLAWRRAAFRDAARALALLAEAENETYANNATGEFAARFQVFLGGTSTPYLERLEVIDQLVAVGRLSLTRICVQALSKVGLQNESRTGDELAPDAAPEPEWHPATQAERAACVIAAIARLQAIAHSADPQLEDDLFKAARALAMLLRASQMRGAVGAFLEALRARYPGTREQIRARIADVLARERMFWKVLGQEELAEIEELHRRFEDPSLAARLRQALVPGMHGEPEASALPGLAAELLADRAVLESQLGWLRSGDAAGTWQLGEALAAVDTNGELEQVFEEGRPRDDFRVASGYIAARRSRQGDAWFEDWVERVAGRGAAALPLLLDVTWRCGATNVTVARLAKLIRDHGVDDASGQLGFGSWYQSVSPEVLEELLLALADREQFASAATLLVHRLESSPAELGLWRNLAVRLVVQGRLIRTGSMTAYIWGKLARLLLPADAVVIASAILREHANRDAETWFIEHSEAHQILSECVTADPDGIWPVLSSYLGVEGDAYVFSIGFPHGMIERMPVDAVYQWAAGNPKARVPVLARISTLNFETDESLASKLLGEFGEDNDVRNAFFSAFISGGWSGAASEHWAQLAQSLESLAARTRVSRIRDWARSSADDLRSMAENDKQREDEEELRRR